MLHPVNMARVQYNLQAIRINLIRYCSYGSEQKVAITTNIMWYIGETALLY